MGKILLVEDDNNLREIYGARLQAEGHEIVSARDGEEALAIAVKEKPDLILADVMMPRISGFDMLDILRNAPETKNTKIIMMTALSQQEDKEHAQKLGADKYLVKSQVTLEDVAKVVRETLGGASSEGPDADSAQPQTPPKDEQAKPNAEVADKPAAPPPPADAPSGDGSKKNPQNADKPVAPPQPAQAPIPPTPPPASQTVATDQQAAPTPTAPPAPASEPKQPPVFSSGSPQAATQPAPTLGGDNTQPKTDDSKRDNGKAPVDDASPQKSSSINIPVVEPPTDDKQTAGGQQTDAAQSVPEPPKQQATDITAASNQPAADQQPTKEDKPKSEPQEPGSDVGPNLAQALADEEKQVKDQIDNFEKDVAEDKDEKPKDESNDTDESKSEKPDGKQPEQKNEGPSKDNLTPKKKIIQPINDLSKKPDLEAMAAEEEKTAQVINQAQENIVKPSDEQNTPGEDKTKKSSPGSGKNQDGSSPHDISI
jgi:CheY-like chemotaxis protein